MEINAIRIEDDQPINLAKLSADDVLELVRSENFTWIDIQISPDDGPELHDLLDDKLDFHPATIEDCLHPTPYHQPKMDEEQDYKFITFLYFEQTPAKKLIPRELNAYVSLTYVITVRRDPAKEFAKRFAALPRHITEYEQRAILFLHHILDVIADSFAKHLTEIQDRSAELELSVLSGKHSRVLSIGFTRRHSRQLTDMRLILRTRQALVKLRRTLTAELEIIEQLISEYDYQGAPEESEEIGIYYGDIADHMRKYLEIIESQDRTMTHLMEIHHLVSGHRTSEIIYILTILSAVMLPLNLIVGFFGMNFDNLWFSHVTWGIWLVAGLMLGISVLLMWFFRSKGWI